MIFILKTVKKEKKKSKKNQSLPHPKTVGAFDLDDGTVVYELNDFDESTPFVIGGHVHDIVKLTASVVLAAKELGVSAGDARKLAEVVVGEYADEAQQYASLPSSAPDGAFWTAKAKTSGKLKSFLEKVSADSAADAREEMLGKWTVKSNGKRTFQTNNPELRAVSSAERTRVLAAVSKYKSTVESSILSKYPSFFTVADVAVRLFAGTGSLGKMRYYVLVQGESTDADDDVILDVKQQGEWPTGLLFATSAERNAHRAAFPNEGARVMVAYKALSSDVDDTLGYTDIALDVANKSSSSATFAFSVRQRSPFKATFPYADLKTNIGDWTQMCKEWGKILATQHCRADSRFRSGEFTKHNFAKALDNLVSGNMDAFVTDIADLAELIAAQAVRDFAIFKRDNGVAAREDDVTDTVVNQDTDTSTGTVSTIPSMIAVFSSIALIAMI